MIILERVLEKIKKALLRAWYVSSSVWKDFSNDNGSQAAAAFSFYCFLSLLALMILAGAVLGMVLNGRPDLLKQILDYIAENAPGISGTIEQALDSSIHLRGVLGVTGALGLLYMGTKVIDSFQVWLNEIWGLEKPRYLKKKMKSAVTLCVLALTGAIGIAIHALFIVVSKHLKWLNVFASLFVFFLTSLILFVGLLFIYSYSIEIKVGWRRVWKGALVAALLINPVQMLLTWYYSNIGNLSAVYGSFASIVLTIIIIYYVGYIIFLAAELNRFLDSQRTY